jgi:hypothetical protein
MKILTSKHIILDHNIVSVFYDPDEFLLNSPEEDCIELKSSLGMFYSEPENKFFGFYYSLDPDLFKIEKEWLICNADELDEYIDIISEDGLIDLRDKL